MGCDPSLSSIPVRDQRSFAGALAEVAAWLALPGRGREVLLIYLDDQADLLDWARARAGSAMQHGDSSASCLCLLLISLPRDEAVPRAAPEACPCSPDGPPFAPVLVVCKLSISGRIQRC